MKKKHLKRLVADLRESAIHPDELSDAVARADRLSEQLRAAEARPAETCETWGNVETLRSERADLNRQLNELRAELARRRLADKQATTAHVLVDADSRRVNVAAGLENSGHVDVTINGDHHHLAPGERRTELARPYPPPTPSYPLNPEYAANDLTSPKGDQG